MNFNNNHDKNQTLLGASSILSSLLYTCANLFQGKSTRATYRLKTEGYEISNNSSKLNATINLIKQLNFNSVCLNTLIPSVPKLFWKSIFNIKTNSKSKNKNNSTQLTIIISKACFVLFCFDLSLAL